MLFLMLTNSCHGQCNNPLNTCISNQIKAVETNRTTVDLAKNNTRKGQHICKKRLLSQLMIRDSSQTSKKCPLQYTKAHKMSQFVETDAIARCCPICSAKTFNDVSKRQSYISKTTLRYFV